MPPYIFNDPTIINSINLPVEHYLLLRFVWVIALFGKLGFTIIEPMKSLPIDNVPIIGFANANPLKTKFEIYFAAK